MVFSSSVKCITYTTPLTHKCICWHLFTDIIIMMTRTVRYALPYDKALVDTVSAGVNVFRFWSDIAYEHQTSNKFRLHHLGYYVARELFPSFGSMLILTVRDTVAEARKAIHTRTGDKNPKVKAHKGRGLRYNDHCFTMKKDGTVSISTVKGRKKYKIAPAPGYEDWSCNSATLKLSKGRIFLHCQYKKEAPPVKKWKPSDVLGVDRGIKNIIACSDNTIMNSKKLRNIKGRYQHVKSTLQSKGTRSAKRRLNAMSGREERFVMDVNHCISKHLIGSRFGVFVLEELKNIKKNSVKGKLAKKTRKLIGGWSFRQFQTFLEYKAEAVGKVVVYVDPKHTSRRCSCCGHTEKANRKGRSFRCVKCNFSLNADLNASRNIAGLGISVSCRADSQAPLCSS